METGLSYNKQRLRKVGYFGELMSTNEDINDAVRANSVLFVHPATSSFFEHCCLTLRRC